MSINIENMELEIKKREVHATRITQELLTYRPTQVNITWDEDKQQWAHEATIEEELVSRKVMKAELLYEGDEEPEADEHFDEAVLRFHNHKVIHLPELEELAKAIAYGFNTIDGFKDMNQIDLLLSTTALRNMISEIAHSMNRKGLVSNDDVGVFVADLYAELKL